MTELSTSNSADVTVGAANPYLEEYKEKLSHQLLHNTTFPPFPGEPERPWEFCLACRDERQSKDGHQGMRRKWSWAVPNAAALEAIDRHSPTGVIEIGAGAGYWASLLRERGVDVLAFDPNPPPSEKAWNNRSEPFTEILIGDHTVALGSPERTLFLCWPSYDEDWTHEVIEFYSGDTVVYVGEGSGGCTGTDRMHALLGIGQCWHFDKDDKAECDACGVDSVFEVVEEVSIPQWAGLHDSLHVCKRK